VLDHDRPDFVVGEKIGGGSVSLDFVGPVVDVQLTAVPFPRERLAAEKTNVVAVRRGGEGRGFTARTVCRQA
jgi:hypothetical protein